MKSNKEIQETQAVDNVKLFTDTYNACLQKFNIYMQKYKGEPYEFWGRCYSGNYYDECKKYKLANTGNWLASMVTGMGPLFYRTEKNEDYLKWAEQFKEFYRNKVFVSPTTDTMHDIGFLYSPYSVAMYQLTGDRAYRETALKAADELAKRFHIRTGCIDAWGNMTDHFIRRPVKMIIDTMMNLSLLFWAWKETKHVFYLDVARAHIETVKKYLLREDGSVAHQFHFDRKTGEVIGEHNSCGYSNGSYWARGTGWAIYGFAIASRYMVNDYYLDLNKEYFDIAARLAENYIHTIGDGNFVPVWDFRLPKDAPATACGEAAHWDETKSENCKFNVDTSACAIVACGLLELLKQKENDKFRSFAENSLSALCKDYFNRDMQVPGFLKRQNGADVYTLYGDYYFAEALQVYLNDNPVCW